MKFEYYLFFNVIALVTFLQTKSSLNKFDKNIEYNSSQSGFYSISRWMKIVYGIKSTRIPKYAYVRAIDILSVLLGPIFSLVYFLSNHNNQLAKILIIVQAVYCVANLVLLLIYYEVYCTRIRKWKKEQAVKKFLEETEDGGLSC